MDKLSRLLDDFFDSSQQQVRSFPGLAYQLPHKILELTAAVISNSIPTSSEFSALLKSHHQLIDDCLSLDDLHRLTAESVTALCEYCGAHLPEGGSSMLVSSKAYIQENYTRKLCLAEIADHVHLNSQYFSVRFKQEAGISVTDYITNLRMEHAKLSLRTTTDTVQFIAESAGYPDAHYFSRVFKRLVGLSPMEYRRQGAHDIEPEREGHRAEGLPSG